jgi:hypothetical protein
MLTRSALYRFAWASVAVALLWAAVAWALA